MPELRWILVVVGLLLLAGLWWWETRRRLRQPPEEVTTEAPSAGEEPESISAIAEPAAKDEDLPAIRATRRERGTAGRNPPVIEIPGDVEPELAPPKRDEEFVPPSVPYRSIQDELDEIPEELRNLPRDERAEDEQRQPWVRTQPLDRNELKAQAAAQGQEYESESELSADSGTQETSEDLPSQAKQRIVALRLIAPASRWPGRLVIEALQAEGLTYGKYSIFHRERDDGKTIFFVASMVEPGSFDLDTLDDQSFPGISVFAVIPGPVDAPTTFDMMLSTARRLAQRLAGHLQDEQGSTLTAQRILNLREELVHFEHLARRVKQR